jgi:hypothetical protein
MRCSRCRATVAVAPDREEPAGGTECWRCAFNATDLAIMKKEAADMRSQLLMEVQPFLMEDP